MITHRQYPAWIALLPLGMAACGSESLSPASPAAGARSFAPGIQGPLLVASPDPVSLGSLNQGQGASAMLTIRNPRPEPRAIAKIETSCPCIRVTPGAARLGPGESVELAVTFDPTEAPDFHGGLSVNVIGREGGNAVLFQTRAELTVRPANRTLGSLKPGG